MSQLIGSSEQRESIGRAGQAYVEREFSETRFRQRLHDFYHTLPGVGRVDNKPKGHADVA